MPSFATDPSDWTDTKLRRLLAAGNSLLDAPPADFSADELLDLKLRTYRLRDEMAGRAMQAAVESLRHNSGWHFSEAQAAGRRILPYLREMAARIGIE